MDKRTILAIVLSLAVLLIYQLFFMKQPAKPPAQPQTTEQKPADGKAPPAAPALSGSQVPTLKIAEPAKSLPAVVPEKTIPVDTPLYTALFSSRGGALKSLQLKNYRKTIDKKADLTELVNVKPEMPLPLSVTFPGSSVDVSAESHFETGAGALDLTKSEESQKLIFVQNYPGRIKIEKIYTIHPGKYTIDLEVRMYNLTTAPLSQTAALHWYEYVDPKAETDSYTHEGPVALVKKEIERPEVKKIEAESSMGPDVPWGGIRDQILYRRHDPSDPLSDKHGDVEEQPKHGHRQPEGRQRHHSCRSGRPVQLCRVPRPQGLQHP